MASSNKPSANSRPTPAGFVHAPVGGRPAGEQGYQPMKEELGLDHFEAGRGVCSITVPTW
jgi:hypothetical protein